MCSYLFSIYLYVHIYMCDQKCIHLFLYMLLSLSLSIYIYINMYFLFTLGWPSPLIGGGSHPFYLQEGVAIPFTWRWRWPPPLLRRRRGHPLRLVRTWSYLHLEEQAIPWTRRRHWLAIPKTWRNP